MTAPIIALAFVSGRTNDHIAAIHEHRVDVVIRDRNIEHKGSPF
jgi:hypothetical protein